MLSDYAYIGVFVIVAIIFPVGGLLTARFLYPRRPTPVKRSTYECGLTTEGETWVQYNARFYLYALVFVVFDIETIFLYPWAVYMKQLALFGLVEMLIFIGILVVGYVYAWKKRALEWS